MTVAALPLPFAGPGDGLERALGAQRRVAQVEAEKIAHLADYLHQSATEAASMVPSSLPGSERIGCYGGDGTPAIAEFTVCEISAGLGVSQRSASRLVADVLDITHRLPILYTALEDGRVELWRLRKVAAVTRDLSEPLAREVDIRLSAARSVDHAPLLARASAARVDQIIDQVRGTVAPDKADDEIEKNLADRYIEIRDGEPGIADLSGTLATGDAARLEQRLRIVAGWLRELGDHRTLRKLESVAMGWIAEPERLEMLHEQVRGHRHMTNSSAGDEADAGTDHGDNAEPADASDAASDDAADTEPRAQAQSSDSSCGGDVPDAFRRPDRPGMPTTKLYLHWDHASDTFTLEGIGAVSKREALDILNHSKITLTPVIDLTANPTYTGYVAPPKLKEHTALLNAGLCTFPSCSRQARHGEYDHIVDYDTGGATDARNGHRLCKHHHRAKTFADWRVYTPAAGMWLWRSPKGRYFLVTAGTTTRLDTRPLDWAAHHTA